MVKIYFLLGIRNQLLRNRAKSILQLCTSLLLVGCLSLYLGNIQSTETALHNLAENIPVIARVVSRSGEKISGLNIGTKQYDTLQEAGVKRIACTVFAAGAYSPSAREQEPFVGGDTTITGANDLDGLGIPEENFTFAQGYDSSFLSQANNWCVMNDSYAAAYGLQSRDEFNLSIFTAQRNNIGLSYEPIGDCSLQIIGTYSGTGASVIVSPAWLRSQAENAGAPFFYDSCYAEVADATKLSEFKQTLITSGAFMETFEAKDVYTGDALSVEDELFVKTGGKLQRNLDIYRFFLLPFFGIVIFLITLITFLVLRSNRRDIAILSSLGCSKSHIYLIYFTSTLIVYLLGSVIALLLLPIFITIEMLSALAICGIFLACTAIGAAVALLFLLHFDVISMLTKVE